VHFRTELSCEKDLNDEYRKVIETLDGFHQDINRQISELEKALGQIDKYQHDIQQLKQKLIQEEQLLKTMTPDQSADNVQVRVCFCCLISLA
jgi:prefoldin subunit 5